MKKTNYIYCILFFAVFVSFAESQVLDSRKVVFTYSLPVLTAVEGYPEVQTKEKVVISVVPIAITKHKVVYYEVLYLPKALDQVVGTQESQIKPTKRVNYRVTETPRIEVSPDRLLFNVTVTNNLARVLRLAGTIISMQADGKSININKNPEFLNGFILPRQQTEYRIEGPTINEVPDKCNFALLLYEVITETDDAGNPTKKSNFEWYFTCENLPVTEELVVTTTKMKLTPLQASEMRQKSGIPER